MVPAQEPRRKGAVDELCQSDGLAAMLVVLVALGLVAQPDRGRRSRASATALGQDDGGGFVDKAQNWAKKHQIVERLNGDVDGWYPRLGGMTRGGGFALGPGYRFHARRRARRSVGGVSLKAYKAVDAQGPLGSGVRRARRALDELPLSRISRRKTSSAWDSTSRRSVAYQLWIQEPRLHGARPRQADVMAADRRDDRLPEAVDRSGATRTSRRSKSSSRTSMRRACRRSPNFFRTTLFAEVDYRDVRGNPRSGGFYHAAYGIWNDRSFDAGHFLRFDVNLAQYVPLDPSKGPRGLGPRRPQLREQRRRASGTVLLPAVRGWRRHDPQLPRVPLQG